LLLIVTMTSVPGIGIGQHDQNDRPYCAATGNGDLGFAAASARSRTRSYST
jgi:hypothetical protein